MALSKTAQMYKKAANLSSAEGVAWVFTDVNSGLSKYPFTFPQMADHEVRAKILYTGLCQSDVSWARKHWFDNCTYPLCAGHEIVAEVTHAGKNVKNFKKGDIFGSGWQRDSCHICPDCTQGFTNTCTGTITNQFDPYFGGYATHLQISENLLCHIPKGMDLKRVPPILCAGVTVFAPIFRWFNRQKHGVKGMKAAVVGPGGLGHLALQYLKAMECEVTALTNIKGNDEALHKLGADHIAYTTNKQDLEKLAMTQDLIINTSPYNGGDFWQQIIDLMRKRGTLVQLAIPDKETKFTVTPNVLIFNQLNIEGSIVGSRSDMEEVLDFSNKHDIYPICEEYDFESFPKALDKLENGAPKFRCVVDVQSWAKANGFDK